MNFSLESFSASELQRDAIYTLVTGSMLVMHVLGDTLETTTQTKAKDNNFKLNNDQVSLKATAWAIKAI